MERLLQIIESSVKPVLRNHGGDVEILDVSSDGWVKVRLIATSVTYHYNQEMLFNVIEKTFVKVIEDTLLETCQGVRGVLPVVVAWLPNLHRPSE